MNFNCLIPELRVTNLTKSKQFYTEILGFKIEYERFDFAMISLDNCQIMLQQLTLPSKKGSWNVSDDMQYPFGRGINFQIILPNIAKVYNSLKQHNIKIFIDLLLSDYQENNINNHVLEFLVQDPDGYLLRFQQDVVDWHFGDNKKMADELFDLVLSESKTATSYLYDKNDSDNYNQGFSVLTNWDKSKRVILETTKVYKTTFNKVTKEHAFKEGESDRTLKSWKEIHKPFFENELKLKNLTFTNNCELVCEEFKIVKRLDNENE